MEWNVTRLIEPRDQKSLLIGKVSLALFMGLRAIREHDIMHRDSYSLSSLKERRTLDISRARVFL